MKLSVIFVSAMLVVGQEAWAKDQPKDLNKSSSSGLVYSVTNKEQVERSQEIPRLVFDVVNGNAVVKPSMVPTETFDRIYFVEKRTQELMTQIEKNLAGHAAGDVQGVKAIFYAGQLTAMRDILYIAGILPELFYSPSDLDKLDKWVSEQARQPYYPSLGEKLGLYRLANDAISSAGADRMRLISAMLLLLNYKESNPIPPGDIVQVSIIK